MTINTDEARSLAAHFATRDMSGYDHVQAAVVLALESLADQLDQAHEDFVLCCTCGTRLYGDDEHEALQKALTEMTKQYQAADAANVKLGERVKRLEVATRSTVEQIVAAREPHQDIGGLRALAKALAKALAEDGP